MIFEQLQEFTKTGCFRFENGILSNHYIESLIKNLLITPTSHQLYLNHVGLSLPLKANFQEPIIGPVTSKEYVRNWVETYPTHVLYQWSIPPGGMVINHDFSERIEFEGTPPLVEKLLELLYSSTNWKVIELNDIRLDWQERSCSLRWKPNNFVKVLERNRHLIRLSCDLSMSYDNSFKELMEVIAKHPNLQELNLLATILSENDYHALNELLDINYTIATIITKPPEDSYLLEMYNALQTRLSASPIARFINKQFTPEKLLALAELGLEPGNHRLFNLLLKRPASLPTITGREKQADYARLPTVYKLNRRLWENNESLWHLNLDKQLENGKSVGFYLLEKAIKAENKEVSLIKSLLACGVNLLEQCEEPSLLAQLFVDRKRAPWKEEVIKHLQQQEWSDLIPQLASLNRCFPDFCTLVTAIKECLDKVAGQLMDCMESSYSELMYRFSDRCKEWERALCSMITILKMGTVNPEIDIMQIDAMNKEIDILLENTQRARRGLSFSNYLNFNPELEKLVKELKTALNVVVYEGRLNHWKTKYEKSQIELNSERETRTQKKAKWKAKVEKQQKTIDHLCRVLERHGLFQKPPTPIEEDLLPTAANANTRSCRF